MITRVTFVDFFLDGEGDQIYVDENDRYWKLVSEDALDHADYDDSVEDDDTTEGEIYDDHGALIGLE